MNTDSTTNLLASDGSSHPSPTGFGASPATNPLKRLGAKIKKEIDDIRAFKAMSLEEIRALNQQRFEEHVRRQDEKEQMMAEKYGAVGRAVAKRTRTTLSNPPCCSLAVVGPDLYKCIG